MPLLESNIMDIYKEIKEKLNLIEENNKKAKRMLDSMDKLGGIHIAYLLKNEKKSSN